MSGCSPRHDLEVDVVVHRHCLCVHAEDAEATQDVRTIDNDSPIEASGPQEGRIEDVRPVRCGDEDDALIGLEAVHLHQELVESLFALVVAAA